MGWGFEGAWLGYLLRVSFAFLVALGLSRAFAKDLRFRRWLWGVVFAIPLVGLVPVDPIAITLGALRPTLSRLVPKVYELDSQVDFANTKIVGDPGIQAWVVVLGVAAAFGLLLLAFRWFATLRIVREADQVVEPELIDLLYELGTHRGLSNVPTLKRSDQIESPCVWGITQPVILIPSRFVPENEHEWRIVLEHEIAHVVQHDPLRILLYAAIRYCFWWNPLVWLGFRDAVLAQEETVDRRFKGSREYVQLLVRHASVSPAPSGLRLGGGNLLARVRGVREVDDVKPNGWRFATLLALVPAVVPVSLRPPYQPELGRLGPNEVVYQRFDGTLSRLWRCSADGRGAQPMPVLFTSVGVPDISPDGRWIAYTRIKNGQEDIYIARVDGTGERCVLSTPARDYEPKWSPDGRRLLFITMTTGNWEIGLLDLETRKWHLITDDGNRNLEASWHPSGKRIVFSSHRTGTQKLWSMNLDGSNLVQLTFGGREDTGAVYSPDGRWLAFSSARRMKYEATLLDLQTGVLRPLVPITERDSGEVRFVDGGESLVMTCHRSTVAQIGKVNIRTGEFTVITDESAEAFFPAGLSSQMGAAPSFEGEDAADSSPVWWRVAGGPDTGWVEWPTKYGGNGHWYRAVGVPKGITWEEARAAAEAQGGYLATIESAEEGAFLIDKLTAGRANPVFWFSPNNGFGPWIGLVQEPGSTEPRSGWHWVTGEPLRYTQWAAGVPDNANPNEAYGILYWTLAGQVYGWQDVQNDGRLSIAGHPVISYIVEREATGPNVYPDSFGLPAGSLESGSLRDLLYPDDEGMSVSCNDSRLAAEIEVGGTSLTTSPAKLTFRLETRASRGGLSQKVSLLNYATGKYVAVDAREATQETSSLEVARTTDAHEFFGPDGHVRARVAWAPINDEAPPKDGWECNIDLVRWVVEASPKPSSGGQR